MFVWKEERETQQERERDAGLEGEVRSSRTDTLQHSQYLLLTFQQPARPSRALGEVNRKLCLPKPPHSSQTGKPL